MNSKLFQKKKNIAFAFIKEYFVKHSPDEISNERLSEMLSDDCNNIFKTLRRRTDSNYEEITKVK